MFRNNVCGAGACVSENCYAQGAISSGRMIEEVKILTQKTDGSKVCDRNDFGQDTSF